MGFFQTIWFYITHIDIWFYTFIYQKSYFELLYNLLIIHWLWIPILYAVFRHMFLPVYKDVIQDKYKATVPYILLAIDVPKKNEQSIYAVEQIFVQILGGHQTFNWWEEWVEGLFQLPLMFEIVSIEGYIQFIIRCPKAWRDLVEGAVYGQYPDAEITQVEDYVNTVPTKYPDPVWDMWGVEWFFDNKENLFMPLKTYPEFEDKYNEDSRFVDPLAGLLEAMSRIGKGEQIWFHLLAKPLGVDWSKKAEPMVAKLIGKEEKPKPKSLMSSLISAPAGLLNDVSEQLLDTRILGGGSEEDKKKEDAFGKIWRMSPGERTMLEAMERKINKLGYGVKMRYGYFAKKEVMNKARGVNAIIGAVKQFNSIGRQGLKPELKKTATKAAYFFVKKRKAYRQRKMTTALKKRQTTVGMPKMPMSTEELATLYHFPSMLIKSPMLKKTELIKSSAPSNLPFEEVVYEEAVDQKAAGAQAAPSNIPFSDEHGHEPETPEVSFDYDSDYFEKRFAVDKKSFQVERSAHEEKVRQIEMEEEAKAEISPLAVEETKIKDQEPISPAERKEIEDSGQLPSFTDLPEPIASPSPEKVIETVKAPETRPEQYKVEIVDFHAGHEVRKKLIKKPEEKGPPPDLPYV